MTKKYLVYKIVNQVNGKVYVGITSKKMEVRLRCHITRAQTGWKEAIYCAMRKYGISNFLVIVVDDSATSFKELQEKEREYIKLFNSFIDDGCGYNMTRGGEGNLGWKPSEATRKVMSEKQKGRKLPEEQKQRHSERMRGNGNPRFGVKYSAELREKLSIAIAKAAKLKAANEGRTIGVTKRMLKRKRILGSRDSKKVEFQGQRKSLTEWGKELGIGEDTLWRRLNKYGWTVERALTEIEDGRVTGGVRHTWKGKSQSLPQWAKEYGLPYDLVFTRVTKLGWALEKALTTPVEDKRITYNGKTQTKAAWARELGISPALFLFRLKKNTLEEVMKMPPPKARAV